MVFHHVMVQFLFVRNRARKIQTAVAFLTTRVTFPDTNDCVKLKRVHEYLNGTYSLMFMMEQKYIKCMEWYINT